MDAQLEVKNGYLAIDLAHTKIDLGCTLPQFQQCNKSPDAVKDELVLYLNDLLHARGTIFQQRLRPEKQRDLKNLVKNRPDIAHLNALSDNWQNAEKEFRLWAHKNTDLVTDAGLADVFDSIPKDPKLKDGPVIAVDVETLEPPEDPAELYRHGRVLFEVAAPITGSYQKLRPERNVSEWTELRGDLSDGILKGLQCQLWYRDAVIDPIADYLEMRGITVKPYRRETELPPRDTAGISPERPQFTASGISSNRVIVSPDPLLEGVVINASPTAKPLRRLLYTLLPTPDYNNVMENPSSFLCLSPPLIQDEGGGSGKKIVMLSLHDRKDPTLNIAGMYVTRRFFAERARQLDEIGYSARLDYAREEVVPSGDEQNRTLKLIYLVLSPKEPAPTSTFEDSDFAGVTDCPPSAREGAKTAKVNSQPLENDRDKAPLRPENLSAGKTRGDKPSQPADSISNKPYLLQLGLEKEPARPLRYSLGLTKSALTGKDDSLSAEVGIQGQPSGDLQYSRDFVAFSTFNRRVQLSLKGFSYFTPDRSLSTGTADERRTGGEGRVKIDIWRNVDGSWGQIDSGASWRESHVVPNGQASETSDITKFDIGLAMYKGRDGTPRSEKLEVTPTVQVGEAGSKNDWFFKPGITGHIHTFIGNFSQYDLRGNAVTTVGSAPDVELPSFGGEDSVRGYKPDAALAKTVWALQNEVWFPARLPFSMPKGLDDFLRRSVAAAIVADIGGAHDTSQGIKGIRGGVGAGLRLVWQDYLTFRLDWAYPIGGEGRNGRFYFTVTTWPAF